MLNYLSKILFNKVEEVAGGGDPKDAPAAPPENAPNDPASKKEGDNLDEFGYEKVKPEEKEGAPAKEGDVKKEDSPKKPEKVANPVTGYEADPPKVDDVKPPEEKPAPPATELDKKLEGLHPSFAEQVKLQMADLGLEGEKIDKFISLKKAEQQAAVDWQKKNEEEMEHQEKVRKAAWHKELKEDPVFGGEKFLLNVTRGEKVLDEYLSELKKELTDAKQMLRPSVMRGLARLADRLYPDDKVVHGDPPPSDEKDREEKNDKSNPLAFYE